MANKINKERQQNQTNKKRGKGKIFSVDELTTSDTNKSVTRTV
jgi:hypothetical protein